jgi:hypothetical protein
MMEQMSHPVFNPGNVKFSLAQLAKEEEARKPLSREEAKEKEKEEKKKKKQIRQVHKESKLAIKQTKKEIREGDKLEKEEMKEHISADKRQDREMEIARKEQHKAREAVHKYVNPQFAEKERFKTNDSTEKQLGNFRPNTQLYSSQRTELSESQKSNIKANRNNPLTIVKPLRPNILDAMADEREKELAEQRKKTGLKWVTVNQR